MEPTDILTQVAAGKIPLDDIEKAKGLRVVAYDNDNDIGYLGFSSGEIDEVDLGKYNLFIELAGIMAAPGSEIRDVSESPREAGVVLAVRSVLKLSRIIANDGLKAQEPA